MRKIRVPDDTASAEIDEIISESKRILELTDGWNGHGSIPISESAWKRATDFVRDNAVRGLSDHGGTAPAPDILPGPDGSVDLEWENGDHELLIRVPAEEGAAATVLVYAAGCMTLKGTMRLDGQASMWLLSWITS